MNAILSSELESSKRTKSSSRFRVLTGTQNLKRSKFYRSVTLLIVQEGELNTMNESSEADK